MTCITGSTDFGILTVDDPTGFAVGDTIHLRDVLGDWEWTAEITAIAGSAFTLAPAPDQNLPNLEVCRVGSGSQGWFGPGSGDCGCCECTCEEVRDAFGDTLVEFSGGAPATLFSLAFDKRAICYGQPTRGTTYSFPGFADDSLAIDTSDCHFAVGGIAYGTNVWGGGTGFFCESYDALYFSDDDGDAFGGYILGPGRTCVVSATAGVQYFCREPSTHVRLVSVGAEYCLFYDNYRFPFASLGPTHPQYPFPGWTLSYSADFFQPYHYIWKVTVGNVNYEYDAHLLGGYSGRTVWSFKIWGSSEVDTTIDLSAAPPYFDPLGFLVGVATVT